MPHRILVVDDRPENIQILMEVLQDEYAVIAATSGEKALELSRGTPQPDLILLDIFMPEMDGFEVCRALKASPGTKHIPVLFVTTIDNRTGEAIGLSVGAVDYILKPFDPDLVRMRVKNHLELKAYATQMAELAEERARQLLHADRLASLGALMAGIIHEINNPLTYILSNAQLLQKCWESIDECLAYGVERNPGNHAKYTFIKEDVPTAIEDICGGVDRLRGIIDSMKTFSRSRSDNLETIDINQCITNALLICSHAIKYNVDLKKELADEAAYVRGAQQGLEQVFVNLISNAADALGSHGAGVLCIRTKVTNGEVVATVEDNGPGIPEDLAEQIFAPFFTTKGIGKGTGLGLSISKGIIEKCDGSLTLESPQGGGARFVIRIPEYRLPS